MDNQTQKRLANLQVIPRTEFSKQTRKSSSIIFKTGT